jgi:hypothetical protein
MSNLSRRSLVTSAAALPALAVPAVAVASVEPDPIFAVLKAFDAALEAENAGYEARNNADEAFKAKYGGYYPSGLEKDDMEIGMVDRFWTGTHSQIARHPYDFMRCVRAELHRELNRQETDYEANVRPVHEAADAAFEKRWDAMQAAFATPPTTIAGFRALIDFATSESFVTDSLIETETNEPLDGFLNTLYESARLLAVQS